MKTIKDLLNTECADVKIDKNLMHEIEKFEADFVNKNQTNIDFFGSHLLGVHPMRFTREDMNTWFDVVLPIDQYGLQRQLYELPSIYKDNNVLSNVFNITITWLMHKIIINNGLSDKDKQLYLVKTFLIWQYKYWGSILQNNFPHDANPETAEATFHALSRKFELKIHGTWGRLFVARAIRLTAPDSLHYETLKRYDDDKAILYCIEDNWTRLKQLMKDLNAVFYDMREREIKQLTESATVVIDGVKIVKDVVKKEKDYVRYVMNRIVDGTGFVKDELIDFIMELMPACSEQHVRKTLLFMVENATNRRYSKDIEFIVSGIVLYTTTYIQNNSRSLSNVSDISAIMIRIRNILKSPKNTEESIANMREVTEKLVGKANGIRNDSSLANARTAVLLYLLFRALTKDTYK